MPLPAREEYARRRIDAQAALIRDEQASRTLSRFRLAVGIGAVVLCWLIFGYQAISLPWLLLPVVLLTMLVVRHNRLERALKCSRMLVRIYETGLARLSGTWMGKGDAGTGLQEADHPYATDLDLFGQASVFELICTARTGSGRAALARWLQHPASASEVARRHEALSELRDQVDLREQLALLGEEVQATLHPEPLLRWAKAAPIPYGRYDRVIAPLLVLLSAVAVLMCKLLGAPYSFAFPLLLLQTGFAIHLRARVLTILVAVDQPVRELRLLSEVMSLLERQQFHAPLLRELHASLYTEGLPPSRQIARLSTLIELLDSRRNAAFFFSPLLLWGTQFALAVESWRVHIGPNLPAWLNAIGELEALCSLAGFHYERPSHVFPECIETGPLFDGRQIGHPLLPQDRCVRNDVLLNNETRLLLVSGSNMSGKSTLLRSVGVNAVLAFAGAPVCAESLRISPLALGASIRIQDSLQGGESRFYAEITKLREIVSIASEKLPLLFLLDEVLSGTNSHDRAIGAGAVIKGLVERGAIGLVTTHDLTLARIADELAPHARNVHFVDHIENGRLVFDYRMHDGIVKRSNALELMRSIGLEV